MDDKTLVCDKCSEEWKLSQTKLNSQKVKNEYKQEMIVTFFLCPKCKKIYVVNIIDDRSRALKEKMNKSLKMLKRSQEGTQEHSERYKKYNKDMNQLKEYEMFLKNKYSQHFFMNEKGEN